MASPGKYRKRRDRPRRRWERVLSTKGSSIAPRSLPPLAAIRLGHSDREDAETRYRTLLLWFMRTVALLWMAQGLSNWGLMLVSEGMGDGALAKMSVLGAGATIFFAVIDLIAAVGLWLASSWGGVVWLVAIAVQWLALVILPGFLPYDIAFGAVDVLLVAGYFVLTYQAARESDL